MFERFTERARQVVVLAQEEARKNGDGRIDSIAILLGLLREEQGLAARVLASLDVTLESVHEYWEVYTNEPLPLNATPNTGTGGQVPFTVAAKGALEMALREALRLGHNYIGTEHVLLGLVRGDCYAGDMLFNDFGVDPEKVRETVGRPLGTNGKAKSDKQVDPDEDPSAQDVVDALRFALMAQKDDAEVIKLVNVLLDFAPDTDNDRGIDLILRLASESTLKLSVVT